jgi:phospholipid/cholesterol/gamma-HCH transport system substrate-binding protein
MRSPVTTILKAGVLILVVALGVSAAVLFWPSTPEHKLTAYFSNTVGLYPGADVRILGIPVGAVDSVNPVGQSVRVEMHYEAKRKLPADAKAVIVAQSLVSDRFVQITPVYTGGGVLQDRATLDVSRTAVPVEVDEVSNSLNELNKALGPDGANKDGSLSQLLQVGADNLDGNGDDIRKTIDDSAKVLSTLSENRGDITESIKNLEKITGALAADDGNVRQFTDHLAGVSQQLNGEKEELSQALQILGPTLKNVTQFVKGNRKAINKDVRDLAKVTAILVKNQKAFGDFLNTAPIGISNMTRAYDPLSGTLHTRSNFLQLKKPADWICSLAYSLGTPPKECLKTLAPIANGLPINLALDFSWITAMTTHYDPIPAPPDAYGPNGKPGSAKTKTATTKTAKKDDKSLKGLLGGN